MTFQAGSIYIYFLAAPFEITDVYNGLYQSSGCIYAISILFYMEALIMCIYSSLPYSSPQFRANNDIIINQKTEPLVLKMFGRNIIHKRKMYAVCLPIFCWADPPMIYGPHCSCKLVLVSSYWTRWSPPEALQS